jgi:2-methylcitrate dehydratase PrpD
LYLRDYPFGNVQLVLADGGWAVTALLEMAAATGIGLFLGFALRATFAAASISWSQERMLRKAARARENADWQRDPRDRLPL